MKHLWLSLLLTLSPVVHAAIGNITELQGTAIEIKRGKSTLTGKKDLGIESMDTVSVGSNAQTGLTFKDNTKVKITANSKLVIDDFIYDPNKSDASKIGMKVALGTVRYASGQIAKNHQQGVNIKTPTATIAVRGTDFAMTVDEVGRSIVVLLPSCDDDRNRPIDLLRLPGNCVVGVIDVNTDAGFVTLTQAYTATYVTDASQPPLPPVTVDPSTVHNDSNLKKPEPIAKVESAREADKEADKNKSKTNDDEKKVSKDSNDKSTTDRLARDSEGTVLVGLNSANQGQLGDAKTNPCWPFNDCGNEKALNWYYRIDDDRGNTIMIRSGERYDNTTYAISINDNDLSYKTVGDGSNKVTVRIWNR